MTVTAAVETISPEQAAEWLKLNKRNRRLKTREIQEVSRDILEGRWVVNGETIKFGYYSPNGKRTEILLDGQNRLTAIAASGRTVKAVVVRGLDYEATIATIDSGAKRTGGDILNLLRGEKNYSALSAITVWAYRQEHRKGKDRGFTCSHYELLSYLDANPRLREVTELSVAAKRSFKPLKGSVFGAALFHGVAIDNDATLRFAEQVAGGEGLTSGQPAYVLREWLTRAATANRPPTVDAYPAVTNKALIAELEGRTIGVLKYVAGQPFPYVQDAEVIEA